MLVDYSPVVGDAHSYIMTDSETPVLLSLAHASRVQGVVDVEGFWNGRSRSWRRDMSFGVGKTIRVVVQCMENKEDEMGPK